jgi:hypothetical protein
VKKKRGAGEYEKAESTDQGKLGNGFQLFFTEHVVKGRNDKGTRHKTGNVGVEHDHQAPVHFDFIGEQKSAGKYFMH